ncbi:MAG: histidine kinase [Thermomonas sp.]|uniref:sensor histidine kinase n=1 Tax=Thermomonas sp. TaxID=1971895 RepID=UPI001ED2FC8F|nr:histidine kinase [Thermomonas sp.]MBV2208782.1 histidine kinase [Thermomonas sp.]
MFKRFFFLVRITAAWGLAVLLAVGLYSSVPLIGSFELPAVLFGFGTMGLVITGAFSHLHRVKLIAGRSDTDTLDNRQKRIIEIPLEAGEAFDVVDAAVRELPGVNDVHSARDSLQIKAKLTRPQLYGEPLLRRWNPLLWFAPACNQLLAIVTPTGDSGRVSLICEPESPAWSDWFLVDDGTNYENAEAIARAITRRIGERRRQDQDRATQTATEKELTEAKLHLLHAQVEPHFLYNTLASAQLLTRSDPARAEAMLGHLIQYLRHSLPNAEDEMSTLGTELERALAYLEILKIRMGDRLTVQVEIPEALRATPLPAMMLQTLVENAIKHGLEPRTHGGTVWIRARRDANTVAVTVADDGEGFNSSTSGSGIGLKNVRERLRLRFNGDANLAVVANFPTGVAATVSLPAAGTAL